MSSDNRQGTINKARRQFAATGHIDRNLMVALFAILDDDEKVIAEKERQLETVNRRLVSKTWGTSEGSYGARVTGHGSTQQRAS